MARTTGPDLISLSWPESRQPDSIPIALLWSAIGGSAGGALVLCAMSALTTAGSFARGVAAPTFDQVFGAIVLAPLMIGGFSLPIVAACTLLFGLPSALVVRHLALRRWRALIVCLLSAACAQFGAIWLMFDAWAIAAAALTSPFALSAATILWWRLAPPA